MVGSDRYRAARSDQAAWDRARRPKLCKLACRPFLRRTVSIKLRRQWSPEQIAGWLKRTYSGELQNQVSHETIYRSLFIQARGVLKKELLEHLRAKRTIRRSKHASLKRNGLGQIKNAVSISERPASAEDRAVPGHWEGDLIGGSRNSYVATLVERHSRYVMLVKVANKDTESVVSALIKQSQRLPSELYRSLTWDRGKELDRKGEVIAENLPGYTVKLIATNPTRSARCCAASPPWCRSTAPASATSCAAGAAHATSRRSCSGSRLRDGERLEEHRALLPGLVLSRSPSRLYPAGKAVAHVVGYVSEVTDAELTSDRSQGRDRGRSWAGRGSSGSTTTRSGAAKECATSR